MYAHRTRPNVLIQDVKLSNPSMSSLNIKFSRGVSAEWEKQEGLVFCFVLSLFIH